MSINKTIAELSGILKECQRMLGHDDADRITPKTCPMGGLKGFQSDIVPTIVRRLARKLGQPLPEDVNIVNIFISPDSKERLTIKEAAKRFLEQYGPKGASDERPKREKEDHRQSSAGSPKNGRSDAGASGRSHEPSPADHLGDRSR